MPTDRAPRRVRCPLRREGTEAVEVPPSLPEKGPGEGEKPEERGDKACEVHCIA